MNLMPVAPVMPAHVRPLAPLDAEVTDFDLMNLKGPKAGKDPIRTVFNGLQNLEENEDLVFLMPIAPVMPVHPRPLAPLDPEVTDFDLLLL